MRLTVDGRWYGLVVLGFTAAALNTGANLLLALGGAVLGVVAVNALLARRAVGRVTATLRGPSQSPQGAPLELEVRLTARGRSPCLILRAPWAAAPLAVFGVGAAPLSGRVAVRPLARGRHVLEGVRVETDAPFGLVRAGVTCRERHAVLVTPAIRALRAGLLDATARGEGEAPAAWLQGAEQRDRVRGLREFRAGDSPRAIHWRSSARRGSLVVREFERGVPERATVVVRIAGGDDPARSDATLSLGASLFAALRGRGERVSLAVVGRDVRWVGAEATLTQALEALALVEAGEGQGLDLGAEVRRAGGHLAPRVWLVTDAPAQELAGARRWRLSAAADLATWLRDPAPVGAAS